MVGRDTKVFEFLKLILRPKRSQPRALQQSLFELREQEASDKASASARDVVEWWVRATFSDPHWQELACDAAFL